MDKKIINYELLAGVDTSVADMINSYIEKGYQPYGKPYCCKNRDGEVVTYQAMVKYEE